MAVFTGTDTPQPKVAASLRAKRDRTYQDFADDFIRPHDRAALAEFIRAETVEEEQTRRWHVEQAIRGAVTAVLNEASEAGLRDLDGAAVMVSVSDLVATATLHVPDDLVPATPAPTQES